MGVQNTIGRKSRKKKFKVHKDMAHFAKDWDGTGPKVKVRLPKTGSREKVEVLVAVGEVLGTHDKKTQKALEHWAPPPIYVNGKPWFPRDRMFGVTEDSEHVDVDKVEEV